MLPTQNRLQQNREFQRVFKSSRPVSLENLSFRVAKNFTKDQNVRFGFVVSNKIEKRATRRNAIKRQLRQIALDLIFELNPGYDVLVVLLKDFSFPYNQDAIKKQFVEGVRRAGAFK